MKNLFKLLILTGLITFLSSCGKDNKSGGGGGGSTVVTPPAVVIPNNWYADNVNDPANSVNYNTLRNYYEAQSFATHTTSNLVIYHLGSEFGGDDLYNNVNFSNLFNFNFGYCINFFGKLKGDCSNTQNDQFSYQADDIIRKGEFKVIVNADHNTTSYNRAVGSTGLGFEFESKSFTREDLLYRRMLNLDAKPVAKVVISKATLNAQVSTSTGTNSTTTINADYVEYFFSDNTIEGYVISPDLPMLANPVAVTKSNGYDTHALKGILSSAGAYKILSLTVDTHRISGNVFSGNGYYDVQTISAGQRSIILNNPYY